MSRTSKMVLRVRKLGLLTISLGITFGFIEIALRFTPLRSLVPSECGSSNGLRLIYQPSWFANQTDSWSFEPNLSTTVESPDHEPVPIRTNSVGLRDAEISPRHPGDYRIVILGDSYTASLQVAENRSYPVILGNSLNKNAKPGKVLRIINAGMPGFDLVREWGLLRSQFKKFDPDLILVQICVINDIMYYGPYYPLQPQSVAGHLNHWLRSKSYTYWLLWKRLSERRNPPPGIALGEKADLQNPVQRRMNQVERELFVLSWTPKALIYHTTAWMMQSIHKLASDHGIPVIFFLIPMEGQVDKTKFRQFASSGQKPGDLLRPQNTLREFAGRHGLSLLDAQPAFAACATQGPVFFEFDQHLNNRGSACLAELLYDRLRTYPPISKRLKEHPPHREVIQFHDSSHP